jgi:hypothetical protein
MSSLKRSTGIFALLNREASLHVEEVVVDATFLDESTFGLGHEVVHERCKAKGKLLRNDFYNGMNEANRPKIRDLFCTLFSLKNQLVEIEVVLSQSKIQPLYKEGCDIIRYLHNRESSLADIIGQPNL